jgi:hypothetical protein
MPDIVQLCALPDDVLRAVAAFMPPSGLIVLVRFSRTIAVVLQVQLTQRLDDLSVVMQSVIRFKSPSIVELLFRPLPYELRASFGEANVNKWDGSSYYFVEVSRDMVGPQKIWYCVVNTQVILTVAIWLLAQIMMTEYSSCTGCSAGLYDRELRKRMEKQWLQRYHHRSDGSSPYRKLLNGGIE